QIQHQRHRDHVILARQCDQRLACLHLHVGSVDDGQLSGRKPFRSDKVQDLESFFGCSLVVLVIRHQGAAEVGRKHFSGAEVFVGKRRLAAAGWTDEYDERQFWDRNSLQSVFSKMAICVGAPTALSSGPTGKKRTAYPYLSAIGCAHWLNSALVHSKRWSLCRKLPAGRVSNCTLYSTFGVVTTIVFGCANSNSTRS